MESFESFTDIVQIPVIRVKGKLLEPLQQYSKLDYPALRAVADVYQGKIEYLKVRAEVSVISDADLCNYKDCFRPAKRCDDHVLKTA